MRTKFLKNTKFPEVFKDMKIFIFDL